VQPGRYEAFDLRARGDVYARYDEFWRRAAARAWYARGARAFFFLKKNKKTQGSSFFFFIYPIIYILTLVLRAGKQARKRDSKRAGKQTSKRTSKLAGKRTGKRAGKQAAKRTGK
jgi:hypothetical protein